MDVFKTTSRAQRDDRQRVSKPPAERERMQGAVRASRLCFDASHFPINDRQLSPRETSVTAGLLLHLRAAGESSRLRNTAQLLLTFDIPIKDIFLLCCIFYST